MATPPGIALRDDFTPFSDYVAPSTETERKLADMWCQALRLDRVGAIDDFEDLGGSSLVAASIFSEIEKTFGVEADIALLIQAPTVKALAQKIEELVQSSKA
jgi:acyl carrier protein